MRRRISFLAAATAVLVAFGVGVAASQVVGWSSPGDDVSDIDDANAAMAWWRGLAATPVGTPTDEAQWTTIGQIVSDLMGLHLDLIAVELTPGPKGDPGAKGDTGDLGTDNTVVVKGAGAPLMGIAGEADPKITPPTATDTVACPSEKPIALGGGFEVTDPTTPFITTVSKPVQTGTVASGWTATIQQQIMVVGEPDLAIPIVTTVYAYAICGPGTLPTPP